MEELMRKALLITYITIMIFLVLPLQWHTICEQQKTLKQLEETCKELRIKCEEPICQIAN